jgi:chorismate mutase
MARRVGRSTAPSGDVNENRVVAIRGATTVAADEPQLILGATRELLVALTEQNALDYDDIISAIFTVTGDLRAEFPARAARDLGWVDVPLLCTVEMAVPGALGKCIRVLLHAHSANRRRDLRHVYLHDARILRPDLLSDAASDPG